jgi:Tol biopolymer transport system component
MLTANGAKLLDFGLAKPSPAALSALTVTAVPNAPVTQDGVIVGTFQYMSPEQIEGKEVDSRSDIFSLGAVLYEMITGQKAFQGKSQLSVASAILEKEPEPIPTVKPMTPLALDRVVRKCLAKNPDERWQSAADLASELRWISQPEAQSAFRLKTRRTWKSVWPWIVGAIVIAAIAVISAALLPSKKPRRSLRETAVARLTIPLPPKRELAVDVTQAVVLSPDGSRLAFVASESGVSHLYVRRLDQFETTAIPDSEGATFPFFSPNGDWIAYFHQGKLQKAPVEGGLPVMVCEVPTSFGGVWTPKDVIVASVPNLGLATVPAAGGSLQKLSLATNAGFYPQGLSWLGNGDWIAFTDYSTPRRRLTAVNLSTGESKPLIDNVQSASYSAGHLVYYEGGSLWAVPFDPLQLIVSGNPAQIESGVSEENYIPQGTASRTGILAYAPGPAGNFLRNLYLVSRNGVERKIDVPAQDYVDPTISPDGKRVAVIIRVLVGPQQLEVLEPDSGTVTSFPRNLSYVSPAWTPDGKDLLFDSRTAARQSNIYRVSADGTSEPQLLHSNPQTSHVTSAAGASAAVMVVDPMTNADLWLLSLKPPYDFRLLKRTPSVERQGALSPDGRWLAYASGESGRSEIYVEPVSGPGGRRQLSSDGGEQPRWVRSGREIVFRNGTKMMSVATQLLPTLVAGKPVELFDKKFDRGAAVAGYDVTADGQMFVMTRSEHDNPTEIRVVLGLPFDKPSRE